MRMARSMTALGSAVRSWSMSSCGFAELRVVVLVDLGVAEDLEARLVGVVHEEECDAVVVGEIAERDVLLVAAEVGEGDEVGAKDVDEAGRAAAMLDVGPAGLGDGGHVEAVAEGDEVLLVRAELVVAGEGLSPCARIGGGCRARICCSLTPGVKAIS